MQRPIPSMPILASPRLGARSLWAPYRSKYGPSAGLDGYDPALDGEVNELGAAVKPMDLHDLILVEFDCPS
jgi:hypothetical protein